MTILLSGGAKNGKSDLAQELALRLADGGAHYYLATMIPCDGEDNRRIARHRENRAGMGFETVERGRDLCGCLTAKNLCEFASLVTREKTYCFKNAIVSILAKLLTQLNKKMIHCICSFTGNFSRNINP